MGASIDDVVVVDGERQKFPTTAVAYNRKLQSSFPFRANDNGHAGANNGIYPSMTYRLARVRYLLLPSTSNFLFI